MRIQLKSFLIILSLIGVFAGLLFGARNYFQHWGGTTALTHEGLTATVSETILHWPSTPDVSVTIAPELEYLGGQRFILNEAADVEQYMFASKHPDGTTDSLIIFQFESVRAGIDWRYDYTWMPMELDKAGLRFHAEVMPVRRHPIFPTGRPGTDGYQSRAYFKAAGYPLPKAFIYSRFAHVPTEDPTKEMLIIYMRDLSPYDIAVKALESNGRGKEEWADIVDEHLATFDQILSFRAE